MSDPAPAVYTVRCAYGPQALDLRGAARDEHMSYLQAHRTVLRFAGPTVLDDGTPTGALAIVDGSRQHAETYIHNEPFYRSGMFESVEILRFVPQTNLRQTELTVHPDRRIFLCQWEGRYDRDALQQIAPAGIRLLEHGAQTDEETGSRGVLMLVEAVEPAAVSALLSDVTETPLEAVRVAPWRFGHSIGGAPDHPPTTV